MGRVQAGAVKHGSFLCFRQALTANFLIIRHFLKSDKKTRLKKTISKIAKPKFYGVFFKNCFLMTNFEFLKFLLHFSIIIFFSLFFKIIKGIPKKFIYGKIQGKRNELCGLCRKS